MLPTGTGNSMEVTDAGCGPVTRKVVAAVVTDPLRPGTKAKNSVRNVMLYCQRVRAKRLTHVQHVVVMRCEPAVRRSHEVEQVGSVAAPMPVTAATRLPWSRCVPNQ